MTPTIHALLVGINRYATSTRSHEGINSLDGAVADVQDMRALLEERFGAAPDRIRTLIDEQATRRGILDGIRDHLARVARADDIVIFHFSGHGSFVKTDGGAGREGTLVAHDSRGEGGSDLTAGDLAAALHEVRAQHVAVTLDCCHAGNLLLSRGAGKARFLPPRDDTPGASTDAAGGPRSVSATLSSAPFVLLAAAGPHEQALEQSVALQGTRGVFTRALTEDARQSHVMSYRTLMERVRERVRTFHPFQHPQLEGPLADHVVFGHDRVGRLGGLSAWPLGPHTVRLSGGLFSGVTVGSRYAIYPPDADLALGNVGPMAQAEVSFVNVSDALATIDVDSSLIPPGSPVVELSHEHEMPAVTVRARGVPGLRSALGDDAQLRLVDEDAERGVAAADADADADVDIAVTRTDEGATIELPAFGLATRVTRQTSDPALVTPVAQAVRHWARWLNLLRLEDVGSPLRVGLELLNANRTESGERHIVIDRDRALRYAVRNDSDRPLFIAVLAFGDDGSIRVVFPPHAGPRLFEAGAVVQDTLVVEMAPGATREYNVLKAFGTASACDMTVFQLGPNQSRAPDRPRHVLEALLIQASGGGRPLVRPVADEWTTTQVTVLVTKAG